MEPPDLYSRLSSLDAFPQLPQLLSPPTTHSLQRQVVEHPLLSSPLPSSSALTAQIASLQHKLDTDHGHLEHTRDQAVTQLKALADEIAQIKATLSALPEHVEQVEDFIQAQSQDTTTGNEMALWRQLEKQQQAVTSLRSARDYFAILARAQTLWEAALDTKTLQAKDSSASTSSVADSQLEHLIEFAHLVNHTSQLLGSQSTSTTALRFMPFLQTKLKDTYAHLVTARSQALREALTAANWPPLTPDQAEAQGKPIKTVAQVLDTFDVRTKWTSLTSLQLVGAKMQLTPLPSCLQASTPHKPASQEYTPLYSTELIAEPYLLRFRFHFDSSRSTNRLDKPEWYLNHTLGLVRSLLPPFTALPRKGPILKLSTVALQRYGEAFGPTPETDRLHVLLKPLQAKVNSSIPLLLGSDSKLVAHTVSQLLRFDQDLDQETTDIEPSRRPIRLADDVLQSQGWFDSWVQGERASAQDTLEGILDDGDAWTIGGVEGDGVDEDEGDAKVGSWASAATSGDKTTRSARSLVLLLEGLTNTYSPLPELEQRLEFLTSIQLPLLRTYQQRLTRSLDAFESLSAAFVRAIPGGIEPGSSGLPAASNDADMVRGLRGLSRLLKAFLSARHIHAQLRKWSERSFFLELSHDLLNTDSGKALLQSLKEEAEERELDGESLGALIRKGLRGGVRGGHQPHHTTSATTTTATSIWDEPLAKFDALAQRASEGIKRLVVSEVLESLRVYSQQNWLDEVEHEDGDPSNPPIEPTLPTPSLLSSLTTLHTHLTHLLPILSPSSSIPLYRSIATDLSSALITRVVISGGSKRFNILGARRFQGDWHVGWGGVISQVLKVDGVQGKMGYDALVPWRSLRDVVVLLSVEEGKDFDSLVAVLWNGSEREWEETRVKMGISRHVSRDRAREIVRRRVECPW